MHPASTTEMRTVKGIGMAEEEPLLTSPPTQDAAVHVRDYSRFITMVKWGAIVSFIIAIAVMIIIS
jgi:hypothetical protein